MVFLILFEAFLIQSMIVFLGELSTIRAFICKVFEELLPVKTVILLLLLVASRVRLILPLLKNQLGSLLHGQFDSFFPRSSHFLDSFFFTLENLLGLDDLPA